MFAFIVSIVTSVASAFASDPGMLIRLRARVAAPMMEGAYAT